MVGEHRGVGEVCGADGRVVPTIQDDLPPRRRRFASGEDARVFRSLGEARACVARGPQPGVMRAEVPRAGTAHREARVDQPVVVHGIRAACGVERLEDIHLAREFRGVAVAPVGMDDERVGRREFPRAFHPARHEGKLAQRLAASVIPNPSRAWRFVCRALPRSRHDDAEGLHAAINLRAIAAHDEPRLCRPRSLALVQRGGAGLAFAEQRARSGDFLHAIELIVAQRPIHGLVENLHIGNQRAHSAAELREFQHGDLFPQLRHRCGQFRTICIRDGDAGRRELFRRAILCGRGGGRVRVGVGGCLGEGGRGEREDSK